MPLAVENDAAVPPEAAASAPKALCEVRSSQILAAAVLGDHAGFAGGLLGRRRGGRRRGTGAGG